MMEKLLLKAKYLIASRKGNDIDLTHAEVCIDLALRKLELTNNINWREGKDLGCIAEGEYILEVDLKSTVDSVVSKIVHALYIKPGHVFVNLNDNDASPIEPEDVLRWVPFKPMTY